MGRYQAYPEYKDSEVEWLGEIPYQWQLTRLKFLASIKNGQDYKLVESDSGYPVYGSGGPFTFATQYLYDMESVLLGRKGTIDKPLYVNEPFWSVDTMYYTEVNRHVPAKYLYYLALTIQFNRYSTNTALPSMTQENLGNFVFAIPVDELEKIRIANFLDHETAKIDTLIEQQQQLIQLLKEKRQAVISHAVTKGLNPDATMKDSGVEWLGEVPSGWSVVPIKRVCEVKDGTHDTPQYVDPSDESFPLITSKDFDGENISFSNAKYISEADHREIIKRSNTEVGDVLMSMIGGNIGKALIVKNNANFSIKNVALFKTSGCEVQAKFILYYLQSGLLDVQISLLSRGGAQGFLSLSDLRNLVFFKVPREELNAIIEYLNKKVIKFDTLITKAESAIAVMQERRTALISAAVTGKIDVRNWQAPQQ